MTEPEEREIIEEFETQIYIGKALKKEWGY